MSGGAGNPFNIVAVIKMGEETPEKRLATAVDLQQRWVGFRDYVKLISEYRESNAQIEKMKKEITYSPEGLINITEAEIRASEHYQDLIDMKMETQKLLADLEKDKIKAKEKGLPPEKIEALVACIKENKRLSFSGLTESEIEGIRNILRSQKAQEILNVGGRWRACIQELNEKKYELIGRYGAEMLSKDYYGDDYPSNEKIMEQDEILSERQIEYSQQELREMRSNIEARASVSAQNSIVIGASGARASIGGCSMISDITLPLETIPEASDEDDSDEESITASLGY